MQIICGDITNQVIRKIGDKIFYFDSEGVYKSTSMKEAINMGLSNLHKRYDDSYWVDFNHYQVKILKNGNIISKTVTKLKEGDDLEKFEEYLSQTTLESHEKPQGLDRFITKIEEPMFYRVPENPKENTFDFIFIELNIISQWDTDKMKYIKEHKKEIDKMVVKKLKSNKQFQKYGISTNFLRLFKVELMNKQMVLRYTFELKEC